jgi:hypothetical protein
VDERGAPLGDVEVTAWPLASPAEAAAMGHAKTTTNEQGEFKLDVADDQRYGVAAHAAGKARGRAENVVPGTRDLVLRLLDPVGKITGVVRSGSDASPVAAFTVVVTSRAQRGIESVARELSFIDPDGSFVVDGLGVGPYRVQVVAAGYAPSAKIPVEVVAAAAATLDIKLPRGACIGGSVSDSTTHVPLADARVSLESGLSSGDSPMPTVASVSTTADGRFHLCGVGEGLRSVVVAAFAHDARILSGLTVPADGDLGPLAEGEKPKTQIVGVGAQLSATADGLVIGKVLEGGGAAYVGLVAGDTIQSIDGKSVVGLDLQQSVEMIRGPVDSVVAMTVKKTDGEVVEIVVPRRQIRF